MAECNPGLAWHYLEQWAERQPDAEALVFQNERLTWREFRDAADQTARAFMELGIERGDRVAFLGMARNEFLITFMAAAKVGAVWLGLSPKFGTDEISYMLHDAQPRVLITLREYLGRDLARVGGDMVLQVPSLEKVLVIGTPIEGTERFSDFVAKPRPHLADVLASRASQVQPGDNVLLMYTSGSTGRPKGVIHTHHSIIANMEIETARLGIDSGSRLLLHLPINHVGADVALGFAGVFGGATVVSMERFDAGESLQAIERERITMVLQIPSMFLLQMQHPSFPDVDFGHVNLFLWSGDTAHWKMVSALAGIAAKTGARLLHAYGMTETAGIVTYTEDGDSPEKLLRSPGRVAEPFELRIVDENRRPVPDGQPGEVAVRGDTVMREYWRNAAATAKALDDEGWFYTSDLAVRDACGYIELVGRKTDMYKSGGENIFPREIETVLESHPAVALVAVVGVPDEVYGEVGHAFAALKPGFDADPAELRSYCKARLANFKVPKRFFVQAELPLLPNGKIDRRALKGG